MPLPIDRPGKIICVGLNYRDHAEEQGVDLPTAPLLFAKWNNTLIGPGLINLDAVLSKNLTLGRGLRAQVRFEMFNVLNRANFANPSQIVVFDAAGPVASAGRITSTVTSSRQLQFGVKLMF